MNTAFFITNRIAFTKKQTFSRLIIRIAIVAIALSMAVMIISTAMVQGFQREISEKVFGFMGHIQVNNFDRNFSYENVPINADQPFLSIVDTMESIVHVQKYATKPGIFEVNDQIEGIILKGVAQDFDWQFIQGQLVAGEVLGLNEDSMSSDVVISRTTADRLQLSLHDNIFVDFVDPGTMRVRSREFFIKGIYNTGMEEFDKLFALVDIQQIQRLNNWNSGQIGGFELFVKDIDKLEATEEQVYLIIGNDLNSYSIKQMKPNIFDWLNLQTTNEHVILTLMAIVAIINMITALLILILERTNMIGILKSLGASNGLIQRIFLINAFYIIVLGLIWGNFFGLTICFLQDAFGIIQLPEKTYYVSEAPVEIRFLTILLLNLGTVIVSMIAMMLPSILVGSIKPVKAIRFK